MGENPDLQLEPEEDDLTARGDDEEFQSSAEPR